MDESIGLQIAMSAYRIIKSNLGTFQRKACTGPGLSTSGSAGRELWISQDRDTIEPLGITLLADTPQEPVGLMESFIPTEYLLVWY